jgi:CHAD domain-containing protein
MACDTAFRVVARRCLEDFTANHTATCKGDLVALHQMRIALTRLRTAILFFSPMVADAERALIRRELKWVHAQLGAVRDLDVAIELFSNRPAAVAGSTGLSTLEKKVRDSHRRLARVLRSARHRRLIKRTSGWIENGPWSAEEGKQVEKRRARSISAFSARKLARWQRRLLKRSRKLRQMGTNKRHQLRLMNKKLCYSVEFFQDLFADKSPSKRQVALKYLRRAQKSLGQLNDHARARSLATTLGRDRVQAPQQLLGRKREKLLIRTAAAAYRKLAALKPFHVTGRGMA